MLGQITANAQSNSMITETLLYGVPSMTKFVIEFSYSTFEVNINYFILIFNFDVQYLMLTSIISF